MTGKTKILCWVAAAWLGVLVLPVLAADGERSSTAPASSPATAKASTIQDETPPLRLRGQSKAGDLAPGGGTNLTYRMLVYVVVILALGALVIVFMRKVLPRLGVAVPSGRHISVEETAYLGPKSAVCLLRVGSRHLLIGRCRESLILLGDVTDAFEQSEARTDADGRT